MKDNEKVTGLCENNKKSITIFVTKKLVCKTCGSKIKF